MKLHSVTLNSVKIKLSMIKINGEIIFRNHPFSVDHPVKRTKSIVVRWFLTVFDEPKKRYKKSIVMRIVVFREFP